MPNRPFTPTFIGPAEKVSRLSLSLFQTLPMGEAGGPENPAIAPTRVRDRANQCIKNVKWQKEEDALLMQIMSSADRPNYARLAGMFPGKTGQQVAERWDKVLNPALHKGSWTRAEDEIIISYVQKNGTKKWQKLCALLPGRIGKQCRERWRNHLDPGLNHSQWTEEEDERLIDLHRLYGNAWVKIALLMQTRSDNDVKNRWNSTLRKRERALDAPAPVAMPSVDLSWWTEGPGRAAGRSGSEIETPDFEAGRAGPQSSPFIRIEPPLRFYSPVSSANRSEAEIGPGQNNSLAENRVALQRLLLSE
jgi:hypothetical protein